MASCAEETLNTGHHVMDMEEYRAPDYWDEVGAPSEDFLPPLQITKRGANKRKALESPTLISSGEETVESSKEKSTIKKKVQRKKKTSREADGDEGEVLLRTTSMETVNSERLELNTQGGTVKKHTELASSDFAGMAISWLEELDEMRVKSGNLQGQISGQMKKRIASVREAVNTLTGRADACGNAAFLKMRNAELTVQLNASKQLTFRL